MGTPRRARDEGSAVTVRRATVADERALVLLAQLDSARPLGGAVLVAEVDGELRAARSLEDGRLIADPFRSALLARELLAVRAKRWQASGGGLTGRRWRLRQVPRPGL